MSINIEEIKRQKSESKSSNNKMDFAKMLNTNIRIGNDELKLTQKEAFYSETAILIGSGLDIKSCMEVVISEQRKKKLRDFFQNISDDIIEGKSLSQALMDSGKISVYEYYSLKIGEESGRMGEVLNQLGDYYSKKIKQRRQIINTFSYPVLILFTAVLVVVFMMTFIVPLFEELFNRFQGELPALTKTVLKASDFVSNNITGIILSLALGSAFVYLVHKKEFFRKFISNLALRIPLLKNILIKVYLAKFCQSMELLNSARIPILESIRLIRKIIGFYPFEVALADIEQRILAGDLLYESLKAHKIFDTKIISLTKVGEEVNQLDTIYKNMNEQYHDEVQHQISVLNSLLEPVMIVIIGIFVALILISMYLPMFKMSNSMF